MKLLATLVIATVSSLAIATDADAGILGMHQVKLDFTKAEIAKQVTWTASPKLTTGPHGLTYDAQSAEVIDVVVQTTEPIATGTSWRPTRYVSLRATMSPVATSFKLANGQQSTPTPGNMFARYSPDAKNWSTWQALTSDPATKGYTFSGNLMVSKQDSADYSQLLSKYSTLNVPWKSDEEACVQWILKTQPNFFAKHLSFIGYVQFMYEGSLYGGQSIEHIDFDISYSVGGLHAAPSNPKLQVNRDGPWRLK
jgi:hypothetical protein